MDKYAGRYTASGARTAWAALPDMRDQSVPIRQRTHRGSALKSRPMVAAFDSSRAHHGAAYRRRSGRCGGLPILMRTWSRRIGRATLMYSITYRRANLLSAADRAHYVRRQSRDVTWKGSMMTIKK